MALPDEDAVPFAVLDGWPERLPGCAVSLRETGIMLGSFFLEDDEWASLRKSRVVSVRIDDHPVSEEFQIPTSPVPVPTNVLVRAPDLQDWVAEIHGSVGRLLLWDESYRWWIVQEVDLELLLTCAPPGMFLAGSDQPSWWDVGTDSGRAEVEYLRGRYGIEGKQ
jgi:hypothetical protein